MLLEGVWLPIITPFRQDRFDVASYQRLIDHYIDQGIHGLIPLGTTGESPAIDDHEFEPIVAKTIEFCRDRVPIYVGVGGNYTAKVVKQVKALEKYQIEGILSVCPYYNRPDQHGIYEHFLRISEATPLNIIIYNIPYRTGRNIENDTLRRLAELKNIVGLKDSCGDIKQSMELLLNPPAGFSILTGEDILFYLSLTLGGNGGILAASHLRTADFVEVYRQVKANNQQAALSVWRRLAPWIPLLFNEPNPGPIKFCLHKTGLIDSAEARLPITAISDRLANELTPFISASR